MINIAKNKIKLLRKRFFENPNVHALFPVMETRLELNKWVDTPSNPEFADRLVSILPELEKHSCSKGYSGGFVERLNEGTYPAHIIEHCSLAIQERAGSNVSYGKSRVVNEDIYNVVIEYEYQKIADLALEASMYIVNGLLNDNLEDDIVQNYLDEIDVAQREVSLGPSTEAIINAAKDRNIPFKRLHSKYSLFSLGWGKNRKRIWGPVTSQSSLLSDDLITHDKDLTKKILDENGFPVPRGNVANSLEEAVKIAETLEFPLIVKPRGGNHGEGVVGDLRNKREVIGAYEIASEYSDDIIVEEFINGDDYRFFVINNHLEAVSKREPAHVIGDGESTIKELVNKVNKDPKRGENHETVLTKISLGSEEFMTLSEQGYTVEDIPKKNEKVFLRTGGNLSTGGTSINYTDKVHPSIKRVVERISKVLGMDIVGIDIIADDITVPKNESNWGVIEANTSPGLRMHLSPSKGEPIQVGKKIIDYLYPNGDGRIPVIAITGTNGKTSTARMIESVARDQGYKTGMTVTGGIYKDNEKIVEGDTTGPWSANLVLNDPEIDFAVLETARGGILRRGLGFDRCKAGLITNIRRDHIGVDNVEDREDLFWIKSLLLEATEEEGYSIINANDNYTKRLLEKANGTPILFSTKRNKLVNKFIEEEKIVFLHEEGSLNAYINGEKNHLTNVNDLPYLEGGAEMLIENTLSTIASTYSVGIPLTNTIESLSTFKLNEENNPGRMNKFKLGDLKIILDYAHNPDSLKSLGEYTNHLSGKKKTIVFTAPGDRSDELIRECGEALSKWYDKIIVTENQKPEMHMMRGRKKGEISNLIKEGIKKTGTQPNSTFQNIEKSVKHGLKITNPGDILILADLDLTKKDLKDIISKTEIKDELKTI